MKRTREEITKRIEELETKKFYLAMKDRWNDRDFETDRNYRIEIAKLEKELEEV